MSEAAHQIIPFGKYKGQPVEVLQSDKQYCEWLSSQEWFQQRYAQINTLIINNFAKPEDTPEHNKLQAMFLDNNFQCLLLKKLRNFSKEDIKKKYNDIYEGCLEALNDEKKRIENYFQCYKDYTNMDYNSSKAMIRCSKKPTDGELVYQSRNCEFNGYCYNNYQMKVPSSKCICKMIAEDKIACAGEPFVDEVEFEVHGWDVFLRGGYYYSEYIDVYVEVKPCIGDDYPSILRQIKANKANAYISGLYALVYKQFSCSGATLEQVKKIFKASNVTMLSLDEIRGGR